MTSDALHSPEIDQKTIRLVLQMTDRLRAPAIVLLFVSVSRILLDA